VRVAGGRVRSATRGTLSRRCGVALLLTVVPLGATAAQDTSAIDRGVRIGIVYRPGVRPGFVALPAAAELDSIRTILARDLDFSDRFEMITLPGSDTARAPTTALNYPLYQALGADFAMSVSRRGDTTLVTVHDVPAGAVRRSLAARVPDARHPDFRQSVHRLADQVLQATVGALGTAATRVLFVRDGRVYLVDQDGADVRRVSSGDRQAMSPAWAPGGRQFAYMEFWDGKGQLFLHDMATGQRRDIAVTGRTLDFTPAFSPDGKTLAFSRAIEEGTDIYTFNLRDDCCLQRLTVGRFSDNLSPTYSPDGQRIAFVSTRSGLAQIYLMAADGTDQDLFAPFDYGVTGSSNAPEWSPDGRTVAFHRDIAGTLQVFVLDVRTRTVRQLTSVGRNQDPTWAPDSRHLAFVSDRAGYRQLWIIDIETGRIRPLLSQGGARLPAWSPQLPEHAIFTSQPGER